MDVIRVAKGVALVLLASGCATAAMAPAGPSKASRVERSQARAPTPEARARTWSWVGRTDTFWFPAYGPRCYSRAAGVSVSSDLEAS